MNRAEIHLPATPVVPRLIPHPPPVALSRETAFQISWALGLSVALWFTAILT